VPDNQVAPIELAAVLMDAICTPAEREREAIEELTDYLGMDVEQVQSELVFLRAFAVDLAVTTALGQDEGRDTMQRYLHQNWQRLESESGNPLADDLYERFEVYARMASNSNPQPGGLRGAVGQVFAHCCNAGERAADMALLGGAMFAAFYEEICQLFDSVDLVVSPEDESDGPTTKNGYL
jgi:hypothetical protein